MPELGIRELRDGLSRHLAAVKAGATITVTDHGRPIARLVPINAPSALDRLLAEGLITRAQAPKRALAPPLETRGTVSDLVAEQRR